MCEFSWKRLISVLRKMNGSNNYNEAPNCVTPPHLNGHVCVSRLRFAIRSAIQFANFLRTCINKVRAVRGIRRYMTLPVPRSLSRWLDYAFPFIVLQSYQTRRKSSNDYESRSIGSINEIPRCSCLPATAMLDQSSLSTPHASLSHRAIALSLALSRSRSCANKYKPGDNAALT